MLSSSCLGVLGPCINSPHAVRWSSRLRLRESLALSCCSCCCVFDSHLKNPRPSAISLCLGNVSRSPSSLSGRIHRRFYRSKCAAEARQEFLRGLTHNGREVHVARTPGVRSTERSRSPHYNACVLAVLSLLASIKHVRLLASLRGVSTIDRCRGFSKGKVSACANAASPQTCEAYELRLPSSS